jgi:hypothetical protein
MKEAPGSSETSVLTRATRRNNPEDTILHSHRRENLKSYNFAWVCGASPTHTGFKATGLWRITPSGMWRRVALVRTDFSEELIYSFIRVFLCSVRRLLVTASVVPSSQILVTLMKEALSSSKTSVLTRVTRRNIPEDAILHLITCCLLQQNALVHCRSVYIGGTTEASTHAKLCYAYSLVRRGEESFIAVSVMKPSELQRDERVWCWRHRGGRREVILTCYWSQCLR